MWYTYQTVRSDLAYMRMSRRLSIQHLTIEWKGRKKRKIMKLKDTYVINERSQSERKKERIINWNTEKRREMG